MKLAIVTDAHLKERNFPIRAGNYLEDALNKIKLIADSNDYVVFLGDLLHDKNNSDFFFNTLYNFFNQYSKGKFHTILGNHDAFYRNTSSLHKVTIGNLFTTGALTVHIKDFTLAGTYFGVSLTDKDISKVKIDANNENILLAHNYFEDERCPEESLTVADIRKLNYKYVCMGHDHSPHPDQFVGNSMVFRIGSLTRIDSQQYNQDREIFYLQYDTETKELEKINIPVKANSEIFIDNAFANKRIKDDIDYTKIADVLEQLKGSTRTSEYSLDKCLKRLGCPKHLIDNIKLKHNLHGVQYT